MIEPVPENIRYLYALTLGHLSVNSRLMWTMIYSLTMPLGASSIDRLRMKDRIHLSTASLSRKNRFWSLLIMMTSVSHYHRHWKRQDFANEKKKVPLFSAVVWNTLQCRWRGLVENAVNIREHRPLIKSAQWNLCFHFFSREFIAL